MSRHMYFAPSVLRTLFHISFDVVRLAVCVVSLPVSSGCDANAMRICFLRTKIDDNPLVHDHAICGDEEDFSVSHHTNCVGTLLSRFDVALRHAPEVFSKGGLPYFHRRGIIHQFLVT